MMMVIVIYTTVLGICLACSLILRRRFFLSREESASLRKLPNGTMGWPIIGETLSFLSPHSSNSLGSFLQEHCSRYGRVFKSHLFGSPTVVSCDHEFNLFVLQNEEKLFRANYPTAMQGILGKYSLLVVYGDLHKKIRNVIVSFIYAAKSTADFHRRTERLAVSVLRSWKGRNEVSFYDEAKSFALNMMVKTLLSIEPEEPRTPRILRDFSTYMRGFVSLPLYIPGTPYAMAVKARMRLATTVKEIIEERKKRTESGKNKHNEGEGDFLDVIISKGCLNDEEKVSVVLDILLGGSETTATLMSLAVYFLGCHPFALQKLKEEHEAIRQKKENDEPLNHEDYKRMEFTHNVISEALRCGNIVKFVHRKTIRDVEFKGIYIPAGWNVFPIFVGVHTDPAFHENPIAFDPWRWNDDENKMKMMPFGGGARLCPGGELAKVEVAFFLHHLVLNYRWKPMDDELPVAHPYVEFKRNLLMEIEPITDEIRSALEPSSPSDL